MSSTYSPDLRIELIGTGDQAGVWGSTTNTNLGTLLENAIAGYTSVAVIASPQALTAYDGAADEARFAAIALTTTTGANFTVCIPPNSKLYTFYNASSYTATISNSTVKNGITLSGGTTVAIPAGKTISVWSDGTNVAQQSDHFISPTITSPAMSGTPTAPTASTGTSTTQVATTAFVAAALLASVYPVGSIYTNATVSTNPATLLGFGTWTAFGAGRVMVGFDSGNTLFDTAEETGGSYNATLVSHTHTATSSFTGTALGNHTHTVTDPGHNHLAGSGQTAYVGLTPAQAGAQQGSAPNSSAALQSAVTGISIDNASAGTPAGSVSTSNSTEGSSATNANIQPYVTVYMWKRTA
jgi:hypothetical protein